MRSNKSFYKLTFIVLLLVLGVGYAVVSSVGLQIGGTAGTLTDEVDLNVVFTEYAHGTNDPYIENVSFSGTTASFSVKDLSRKGDQTSIIYTIRNKEVDLDAVLKEINVTNNNSAYFNVVAYYYNSDYSQTSETSMDVAAGNYAFLEVDISLIKTPTAHQTANFTISFEAEPDTERTAPGPFDGQ